MTSNSKLSWPAQSPPADFVARTVSVILLDRRDREKKRAWRLVPVARLGARRWVFIAAAAALTVTGGALAWNAMPRAANVPATVGSLPPSRAIDVAPKPVPTIVEPPPEPAKKTPAPPAIAPSRRKEVAPRASAVPDAGRRVILPRCNCQEGICDCLQEH